MSVDSLESASVAVVTQPPAVWHAPANPEQMALAKTGMPWVARCGRRVKHTKPGTQPRKAWQLAPMEPCVVCVGLNGDAR